MISNHGGVNSIDTKSSTIDKKIMEDLLLNGSDMQISNENVVQSASMMVVDVKTEVKTEVKVETFYEFEAREQVGIDFITNQGF